MNLFFDEESQKLIINAKKEMYELKHPYVGSEHLLLSILHNEKLDITKKLNEYDINYNSFRNELIRIVGIGSKENEWFLFTPLLRRIINNATYYSKDNNKMVTPYNLLIAILEEGDGVANRILLGMNINMNKLSEDILNDEYIKEKQENLLLDEIGINMCECARQKKYDPIIGRDLEIERLIGILLRKNKNNPLLIGEAGVGKTAIVEEISRRIVSGNVPYKLKDKIIYSISMSVLVAGTKYRGEFEEKINRILDEAKSNQNIILFIDEVHTLMGAGGAEGAIDASNIIKPYLARGDIKVIGATTIDEYSKYIESDKALDRRFQKIYVEEATRDLVLNILLELKPIYEVYHNVVLNKNIISKIVDYSYKYIFNGKEPDKAIDLLDEVCAYSSLNNNKNQELLNYEVEIKRVEELKNIEIKKHKFKEAMVYKNKEMNLRSIYNNLMINTLSETKTIIKKDMLEKVIINRYRLIPKEELNNRIDRFNSNESEIKELLEEMKKYDYFKNNSNINILLITKNVLEISFLVDKVVKNIFINNNYIFIDMNEFKEYSSITRLIGSKYEDNYIFQSIKENPFSIIYFKSIDKANSRIIKILLDSIDKGYIENYKNEKIYISKCIILSSSDIIAKDIGFNNTNNSNDFIKRFNKVIYLDTIYSNI